MRLSTVAAATCLSLVAAVVLLWDARASSFDDSGAAGDQRGGGTMVSSGAGKTLVLTGGIEHSEKMKPVENRLKPGNSYVQSLTGSGAGKWFMIPSWLAGRTWRSEKDTHYYFEDLQTHEIDRTRSENTDIAEETIGWERDARGDIWQFESVPFSRRAEGDDTYDIQNTDEMEILSSNENRVIERSVSTRITVDKATERIKRVRRTEQIKVITFVSDGQIKTDTSAKVFDADGKPLSIQKFWSLETRTEPFEPVGVWKGKDYRQQFRDFLLSQGMTDRVPGPAQSQ